MALSPPFLETLALPGSVEEVGNVHDPISFHFKS